MTLQRQKTVAMLPKVELSVLLIILPLAATSVLRFTSDRNWNVLNSTNTDAQWRPGAGHTSENSPSYDVTDPKQCQYVACPPDTVEEDRGTYQVRYYPVAPYAKSNIVSDDGFLVSTLRLYGRLRDYFHGNNDKKETLPMTAPVILRMDMDDDMELWKIRNFTMFFYMDPSVKTWPKPMDDSVEVVDVNKFEIYIRTFSGYPVTYGDWMRELLALHRDLEKDGVPFVKTWFYFASYDNPLKFSGRVNEVQILKPHK